MSTPRSEFSVHILNDQGIAKATAIADIFGDALTKVEALVPPGRERALVVTKLQEACFFSKRGIAVDPVNQKATE